MLTIKHINSNYLAQVVRLPAPNPHPNADRLQVVKINFQALITSLDAKEGDLYIYFPLETAINAEFLSYTNSFENKEMNRDPLAKGYFPKTGRVRAVRLRGQKSEGYCVPAASVSEWLKNQKGIEIDFGEYVDVDFDTINNEILICQKYEIKKNNNTGTQKQGKTKKKKESKVIPGVFKFHIDTAHLKKNIHRLGPDDTIAISYKMHGCVDGDTVIDTDLGRLTIKDVVENRKKCSVLAYDVDSGKNIYAPVTDYYYLPDNGDWYEIELENGRKLQITGNNPVWIPFLGCYRKVCDLEVGDSLQINS